MIDFGFYLLPATVVIAGLLDYYSTVRILRIDEQAEESNPLVRTLHNYLGLRRGQLVVLIAVCGVIAPSVLIISELSQFREILFLLSGVFSGITAKQAQNAANL